MLTLDKKTVAEFEATWVEKLKVFFYEKTDREYLENARITRVIVADHTWVAKVRYIFASDEVEDRCWCWTSFLYE